jgi:hypothetical protein
MVIVPVVVPVTVGVKVTLMLHCADPAREVLQVFADRAKTAGLATMLPSATAELELLVIVTVCAELDTPTFRTTGKVIDVGATVTGVIAVPCTATDCGLPEPV